ncbi:inositol monophosphatase [Palleronia sediminis]|uniref:Inositol monophosphatase n=1 Tax=Palleronia sediminis TaxID=2547833 RepID=A0A4R6A913_9RHOB|nr:inositol monophosphatase [Palleronia sediminis]TDL77686.1 inositol monophosphatase [Palleronia sediminis]
MPSPETCAAIVAALRDAARAEILPRFRNLDQEEVETKSGPEDLVTVADRAAEAAIFARLGPLLPGATLLGEEISESDPGLLSALDGAGTVAVIDPIDGTWNYAHGLALFGIIAAIRAGGETRFGALYDPVLDDWVTARAGQGAHIAREGVAPRRLSVRGARAPEDETGYLPLGLFAPDRQAAVAARVPGFGRIQTLRCSCHEYRMLAQGHVDWLIAAQSKPWDHLAGQLIVTEAGGACGTLSGDAWDPSDTGQILMAASSADRLEALRETFAPALG